MNATNARPLAVITGASSGIGLELARLFARNGFDLVIAADRPEIEAAGTELSQHGIRCIAVHTDLSTSQGMDRLIDEVESTGRPADALVANAGIGLGGEFLDQDLDFVLKIVHTNIDHTLVLLHRLGQVMRERRAGRILITGSIAGVMPGTFQAVYNGTKAFLDSFSVALANELKDTGVTVTCLMPGATETEFFKEAGMQDTKVGSSEKMSAAEVARIGFDALMSGELKVVAGMKNKLQAAAAHVLPDSTLAQMHRKMAEPGSGSGETPSSEQARTDLPNRQPQEARRPQP
jgi:short-subunit dehydrogenase